MTFALVGESRPAPLGGWRGQASASAASSGPAGVIGSQPSAVPSNPAYNAAGYLSQELANFFPRWTSGESGTVYGSRLPLDRARDLVRNDPHANAVVTRVVDMLIGDGWLCVPTPDARALGIDPQICRELARTIRSEWRMFSRDTRKFADAHRRMSLNGILRQAARTYSTGGEAVAVLRYDRKRVQKGARYGTCIQTIDPDRLCNPYNQPPTPTLRGGVEYDADNIPVAAHIRDAHIADWWNAQETFQWTRVPWETDWGRPVVIHAYEPDREDQSRSVTLFAGVTSLLKMIGKHADLEIANATANALFAATIETDLPTEDVAERMTSPRAGKSTIQASNEALAKYFDKRPAFLGGVRVPVFPAGTSMKMNSMPRQTVAFPAFQTAFLRAIAAHFGISYEQLSQDWSQVNYSSARAALNEVWRMIKRIKAVFGEQYADLVYMAFLEEAFDRGYVVAPDGAPDFWDMPEAWTQCRWIGPGRGYIDPTKEAQAASLRMELMTSTLEDELAEQGKDLIDTLDELEFEQEELESRGLSRQSIVVATQTDRLSKTENEEERGAQKEAA